MNLRLVGTAICVAILVEACLTLAANSQESAGTATVRIQVRDPGNDRIAGAQVSIAPLAAGTDSTQTADATGTLTVQLPPGSYVLTAAFPGFRKTTKHINVQRGTEQTIEIVLEVGTSSGPIVVETIPTQRAPAGELVVPVHVVVPNPKLLGCSPATCSQLWLDTDAAPDAKYLQADQD